MFPALIIHFWNQNISQANAMKNSGAWCLLWCCKQRLPSGEAASPGSAGLTQLRPCRCPPESSSLPRSAGAGSGRLPLLPALAARQYVEGEHRLFSPPALLGRSREHFSPLCFMDHKLFCQDVRAIWKAAVIPWSFLMFQMCFRTENKKKVMEEKASFFKLKF